MAVKNLSKHISRKQTPQGEPIPGEAQVANNAGGYVYAVDKWARLQRFLILGTDGGTYYVRERELTRDNAAVVEACLAEDAARAVAAIVDVSQAGRAPKNDPAVLALALAAASPAVETRRLAYDALPKVCRIPTHLFHFLAFCKALRGWSGGLRRAVGRWYARWTPEQLAYELVKYQQRDGWSNRDALRLAHAPAANDPLLRWAIGAPLDAREVKRKDGPSRTYASVMDAALPPIVVAYETAKALAAPAVAEHVGDSMPAVLGASRQLSEIKAADRRELVRLITTHGLTREMLPTAALNHADVWAALLPKMPLEALVRNLGKMTAVGLLAPLSAAAQLAAARLDDPPGIRKARLHPMAILNALRVYASGHGEKGKLAWEPVQSVVDALDAAFYLAFGAVEPTGKRILLALDVSGSMGAAIGGTSLTCREAAAALALVTAAVEPHHAIVGFTAGLSPTKWGSRYGAAITPLAITPRQRLDTVVKYTASLGFGGTDCALPAIWARESKVDVDAIVIVTDNETWSGTIHPKQALAAYRAERVADCRQVVVGMTATGFSIADPADALSLDVVGFDLATPQAIATFVGGAA